MDKIVIFFKKPTVQNLIIFFILFISAFVISETLTLAPWHHEDIAMDSSVFKYVAMEIEDGQMPYLDTFDHKGPLIYLINLLGQLIHFRKGVWVFEFLAIFVSLLFIYLIARKFIDSKYLSAGATIVISSALIPCLGGGNFTEEFSLPFSLAAIYIIINYFHSQKLSKLNFLFLGFCFGSICMLRPNNAVWVLWAIPVIVEYIRHKKIKDLFIGIGLFIVGFAAIVFPIIIWLLINGAFNDFIYQYIIFNLQYTSSRSIHDRWEAFSTFSLIYLVPIALLYNIYLVFKDQNALNILHLVFLLFSLIAISTSGRSSEGFTHYLMVVIPALVYPLVMLIQQISTELKSKKTSNVGLVLIIFYLLSVMVLPTINDAILSMTAAYKYRNTSAMAPDITEICDVINSNTNENDKITVVGARNNIYIECHRFSASKYSFQRVVTTVDHGALDAYIDDLSDNVPKIIIFYNAEDSMYEKVDKFIKEHHYQKVREQNNQDSRNGEMYLLVDQKQHKSQ